jgi:hypothetical protein
MTSTVADRVVRKGDTRAEVRSGNCGQFIHRAPEPGKRDFEILSVNIGNPGPCGFRTRETMRLALVGNPGQAEPCNDRKDISPVCEAVAVQQDRGSPNVAGDGACITGGVFDRAFSIPEQFV